LLSIGNLHLSGLSVEEVGVLAKLSSSAAGFEGNEEYFLKE